MTFKRHRGFTLVEVLVALILLTIIISLASSSFGPFVQFKEKIDTEHKLNELQTSISLAYTANAMQVETDAGSNIPLAGGTLVPSTQTATKLGTQCANKDITWQALANYLPEGPQTAALDGYGSPWCILITPQLQTTVNGITLYYHNIAIVSTGRQNKLDAGTSLDPNTGALTLGGDNQGVLISGYSVQMDKLQKTQETMDRLASLYETYFTSQYLANPSRDVTVDYFAKANPDGTWDSAGTALGTGGIQNARVIDMLSSLGIGPQDSVTAYETQNDIMLANYNECLTVGSSPNPVCVRSSSGGQTPPYTALLYAFLPGPPGNLLVKTVTGNY